MCMMEISLFAILIAIIVLIVLTGINLRKLNMESYSYLAPGKTCTSDEQCEFGCISGKCASTT